MRKKEFYFLMVVAALFGGGIAQAGTSVETLPDGMLTFNLIAGKMSYLSLPLTNHASYTGTVTAVTTNTVKVSNSPAPFTTPLATAAAPYFIKFLSGNEAGRVMLIDRNTTSQLTVDTTDHVTGAAVALTTTNFNVRAGDSFEVFPGDTLASVFGAGTADEPALLTGGKNAFYADTVLLFTAASALPITYYFSTLTNHWVHMNGAGNANNVIIYPYSAFAVNRRAPHPDTTLIVAGRVTQVQAATKVISQGTVYSSNHFASNIKLSQLRFGSNWQTGISAVTADAISVWNATSNKFDTFYQKPDSTWRNSTDANTDQSSYVIAAGAVTTIAKHQSVTGAAAFLDSRLPYALN